MNLLDPPPSPPGQQLLAELCCAFCGATFSEIVRADPRNPRQPSRDDYRTVWPMCLRCDAIQETTQDAFRGPYRP